MTEGVSFAPEGRFHNLLAEELAGKEFEGRDIAVLALGGQEGAGVTTTALALAQLTTDIGITTHVCSFEQERDRIYRERTGRLAVALNSNEELQAAIDTDFHMVRQMVNPSNRGSLLILEGRIAPFIAKEMEFAEKDLLEQGRIERPAPFKILTGYLFASHDARLSRKYLDALKQDRTLSIEDFIEIFDKRADDEVSAFTRTWPDLHGATPNNMDFKVRGQQVYDLRKDTSILSEEQVAQWILDDDRFVGLVADMIEVSEQKKANNE